MQNRIMVVDDELDFLDTVRRGLITSGYRNVVLESDSLAAARQIESGEKYDAALIDITMPGLSGVELLERFKALSPETECIMVTAIDEARLAVECLRKGAYDYLVKPISKENLISSLTRALERKRLVELLDICKNPQPSNLTQSEAYDDIITRDPTMHKILKEAELYAACNVPLLISGEPGTGKKRLSRAIHRASTRSNKPYTVINMDISDSTHIAVQLFGQVKDAESGLEDDRVGSLEGTHRGTLLIQNIENMPLDLQEEFLRVIQNGEYTKIGDNRPQRIDVRMITATHVNLENQVLQNRFRNDLYHHLKGGWINLPPLCQRMGDIPLLIEHFNKHLEPHADKFEITPEALSLLRNYSWPGNIDELKAIAKSAAALSQGQALSPRHLPDHLVS